MAPLMTPASGSTDDQRRARGSFCRDTAEQAQQKVKGGWGHSNSRSLRKVTREATLGFSAKHWLEVLSLFCLGTLFPVTYQQAYAWTYVATSSESEFSDSRTGAFASVTGTTTNYFVFTYLKSGLDGKYYIKAYSSTAAIIGSISRIGDDCYGVAMLTSTRFVVAPKTTHDYVSYNAQINSGTIIFALDSSGTKPNSHSGNETSVVIGEPDTDYVYVGQASQNILLLTGVYFSVNKFSTAGNSNNAVSFIDSIGGIFTIKTIELFAGNCVFAAGSSLLFHNYYVVLDKTTMQDIVIKNPSSVTFAAKVEPLDTTSMYLTLNDISVKKFRMLTGEILASVGLPEYHFSIARPEKFYYLLLASDSGSPVLRVVNLTSFTIPITYQLNGYQAEKSMTLGELLYGRNQTLSFVNRDNKNVNICMFIQDYCVDPLKSTCTACSAGRYLTSNSSDYQCLLPAEFPTGYGNDSIYMQPCLGSLTSGCTSCPAIYTTCVACSNQNGFYLYPLLSICYQISTMPDTLGVNNGASPPVVTACSDSNCLKCASSYTQCTQCKPSWYLKNPTDGRCYQNNMENWGISVPSPFGVVKYCSDTNCKWCLANYSVCEECKNQTYFTEITGTPCNPNTLDGFGLKSTSATSFVLSSCSDVNCLHCFADYTYCTACQAPYLLDADDLVCKKSATRKGADGLGYLRNCTDLNCEICESSHFQCQQCQINYYFTYNDTSQCRLNNVSRFGLTPNSSVGQVIAPCIDSNCVSCFSNTSLCQACSQNYFQVVGQEFNSVSCFLNNLPLMGLNSQTPAKLDACTVEFCQDCTSWNQGCDVCSPDYFLVENSSPVKCDKNVQFERGLKISGKLSQPVLSNCAIKYCKRCFTNNSKCQECLQGYVFNQTLNSCILNNLSGQGKSAMTDGTVLQGYCVEPFCIDCFENVSVCNACDAANYYSLQDTKCLLSKQSSTSLTYLNPIFFDRTTNRFSIIFSGAIQSIQNLQAKVIYKLVDLNTAALINPELYSVQFVQESAQKITAQVTVSGTQSVGPSVMQISQRDQSVPLYGNGVDYIDPTEVIRINGVGIVSADALTASGLQTITQVAAILSAITLGIGVKATGGGQLTSMLKIIDSIEYVLYWNGLESLIGNKFIYFWSRDILALLPNYLQVPELELDCLPQQQFLRHNVSCSYINNFGSQLITLAGLLAAFIVVEAISFLSKTLKKRDNVWYQRSAKVLDVLNWIPAKLFTGSLMFALLDGSQIEVIRLSFLTFTHFNTTPGMIGAAIVSALTMILYAWFGYQLFLAAAEQHPSVVEEMSLHTTMTMQTLATDTLPSARNDEDSHWKISERNTVQKLKSSLLRDTLRHEIFGQYRKPKAGESRLYLYIPLMFLGKSVLTQGWVVFSSNIGVPQIWLLTLVDLLYLTALVLMKPFKSKMTALWMLLSSMTMACISGTYLMMNYQGTNLDFIARENSYGYALIVMFSICIIVTIVPGVLENIKILIDWIRLQRPRKTVQRAQTNDIGSKTRFRYVRGQETMMNRVSPRAPTDSIYMSTKRTLISPRTICKTPQRGILTSHLRSFPEHLAVTPTGSSELMAEIGRPKNPTKKVRIALKIANIRKDRVQVPKFLAQNKVLDFGGGQQVIGNLGMGKNSTGQLNSLSLFPVQPKPLTKSKGEFLRAPPTSAGNMVQDQPTKQPQPKSLPSLGEKRGLGRISGRLGGRTASPSQAVTPGSKSTRAGTPDRGSRQ